MAGTKSKFGGSLMPSDDYLGPEAKARLEIDSQLTACGWKIQNHKEMNLGAGPGVAIREFPMARGHGESDYLLFVNRQAVGVIEAKPVGDTLVGVEWQSSKYAEGVPNDVVAP